MTLTIFKKSLLAAALAVSLMFLAGAGTQSAAQGWPGGDRWGDRGWEYREEQKGYRDGLRRGREDAQSNRISDPNNSSHYRKGNNPYRAGFRRGYAETYRQNSRYRRW